MLSTLIIDFFQKCCSAMTSNFFKKIKIFSEKLKLFVIISVRHLLLDYLVPIYRENNMISND